MEAAQFRSAILGHFGPEEKRKALQEVYEEVQRAGQISIFHLGQRMGWQPSVAIYVARLMIEETKQLKWKDGIADLCNKVEIA
jgi:hypothetical protein